MTPAELERIRQDAHEGVYRCSACGASRLFPSVLTVWLGGVPFFGVCSDCIEGAEVRVRGGPETVRLEFYPARTPPQENTTG